MLALLRLVGLRQAFSRPFRTLLTVIGVALGVALSLAIDVINGSTLSFFRSSVNAISGKAKLSVGAGEAGFAEDTLDRVVKIPGVAHAVPMVESKAAFTTASGTQQTVVVLGIDLLAESAVRTYETTDEQVVDDPLVFLNQADSIIVTKAFAQANGLRIDSPFEMLTAHGKETFTVRGLLSPVGAAEAFGGGIAVMDIDGARATFGKDGKTDRIDVVPAAGVDATELGRTIEKTLGPGFHAESPGAQAGAFERMVVGYQGLLAFLGSLGLVVALFLVGNTMAMSVAERRAQIGTLRALGATKRGILLAILAESAVLALLGSALGVVLGRFGASWLVGSVTKSMRAQFVTPIEVSTLVMTPRTIARAVGLGVVASVIAALWPATLASRVAPVEALRPAEDTTSPVRSRRSRVLGCTGAGLLVLLGVASRFGSDVPAVRAAEPFLAMLGAVLAAPWIVGATVGLLRRGLRGAFVLRLACENLLRNRRRTGSNVISLFVGLALLVVMSIVQASFRRTLSAWLDRGLQADLYVSSTGRLASMQVQPLDEAIGAELAAVPGVDVRGTGLPSGFRYIQLGYQGRTIALRATDRPSGSMNWEPFETSNGPPAEVAPRLFDAAVPSTLVSDSFALHFKTKVGDSIVLDSPTGPVTLRVVGTVVDFASPEGVVYLARDLYKARWHDRLVTAYAFQVAPGQSLAEVRDRVDAHFAGRGIVVTSNATLRAQMDEIIHESFAYVHVIEIGALVVGLLGLLSTATMSVLERSRELGMLRAVGMSSRQVARMIVAESLVLATIGGLAAAAIGAYISYVWLLGNLASMLGWQVRIAVPLAAIGATIAAGAVVGALAGAGASARARRITVREALANE